MSNIPIWLASVGLQKHEALFENVSEETFLSLQMTDYGQYGISTIEDKQRLFRLLKKLTKNSKTSSSRTVESSSMNQRVQENSGKQRTSGGCSTELLDLDADDGDLLLEAQGGNLTDAVYMETDQRPPNLVNSSFPFLQGPPPPKIRVIVRKRPINKKEKERGEDDIMQIDMSKGELIVNEPKLRVNLTRYTEKHRFIFDEALAEGVTNDDVYQSTVQPLVRTLFWGGKATCFAYGQTGSGKTYTMTPLPLKSADEIFQILSLREYKNFYLYVSCFEIYGGKVFDLLNARKKLEIREDSKRRVVVVGLKEFAVDSLNLIQSLIRRASSTRSTGTTGANTDSSRSHSIMQFAIKKGNKAGVTLVGKISFIDLAGSERGADTCDNNRQTRLEGAEINKSLLALKECIRALDCEARHVPFRGSKLTAVLRDSFVGKEARTVMIANVSPNSLSVEHSLNTLRYADRVKELRKEKHERSISLVTPGKALPTGYSNTTIEEEAKPDLDPFLDPITHRETKDSSTRGESSALAPPRRMDPYSSKPSSSRLMSDRSFKSREGMGVQSKAPVRTLAEEFEDVDFFMESDREVQGILEYSDEDGLFEQVDEEDDEFLEASAPPPSMHMKPEKTNTKEDLIAQHEDIMNDILDGEEVVIEGHRLMIEKLMELVKEEMNMLSEVDQPGSAIDKYIERLDGILAEKARIISNMQGKVDDFKAKLGQEEALNQALGNLHKQR
eukprot:g5584.t1